MAYLLQHAIALLVLLAVLYLPGWLLARRLPAAAGLGPLRPLAGLILGLGFWIAVLFALAAAGRLDRPTLWTAVALVAVWGVAVRIRGGRPLRRPALPPARSLFFGALSAALLAPFFLLSASPPVSWDASAYHLTVPKLFVDHGGFREVPLNVYSYWPSGVQLLYAMAMLVGDYVLAKLLHFAFGVATLWAVALACRRFHTAASGRLAILLLLANGVIAYELRVAYVDLAYALLMLAGFLFLVEALDGAPRSLWLAGLSCGLVAGVKVTGIAGAAVVGALYLPRLVRAARAGDRGEARVFLARFALPVAALWLPWVARTAWLTGNPVYPFLHGRLGGPDWSEALGERFAAWQGSIGMGREPLDYLLLPLRVILAGGEGYERFDGSIGAFWIVLIPLSLWSARRRALVRRCLAAAGLYFVFWALSSQQMRFLIPVLPLLAIAGAVAVVDLVETLGSARRRRAAYALAMVAAVAFLVVPERRVLAAGYKTLGIYLRVPGDLAATAVPPVFAWVNDRLPADAKLLLVNTNQRFFVEREALADSFFEASQIAEWLSPAEDVTALRRLLESRGVTHVLVENRPRGIDYPPALGELLTDPGEVELLFRSGDGRFSLFALRQPPAGAGGDGR